MNLLDKISDYFEYQILKKYVNSLWPRSHQRKNIIDLIIVDDHFPLVYSAFRFVEYIAYLEYFTNSVVHSQGTLPAYHKGRVEGFPERLKQLVMQYPNLKSKVIKINKKRKVKARLGYTTFLNNVYNNIDYFEMNSIPFIFTLYPGGGFRFNNSVADKKLDRVCTSPMFRKVITNQKPIYEYMLKRKICKSDSIEFLYGGIRPMNQLSRQIQKKHYGKEKDTFDICFVAGKYKNIDKGYEVFVKVAKILSSKYTDIRFHIVGGYDEQDIDLNGINERIQFYGYQPISFFPDFHSQMDIILSPNYPSKMHFDGFPTGCCSDAAICGVAVFCTDILNMNTVFKDREEIVIVSRDPEDISSVISDYYKKIEKLYTLSRKGKNAFIKVFEDNQQIRKRINIIEAQMRCS